MLVALTARSSESRASQHPYNAITAATITNKGMIRGYVYDRVCTAFIVKSAITVL